MVDLAYAGKWNEEWLRRFKPVKHGDNECEGYVVRVERSFRYREFSKVVGKYVRENHVHTHGHWMNQAIVVNELK